MNQKVKSYLQEEYTGLIFYIKNNSVRCVRAGIESIIMSSLIVSWVFYVMKPFLADMNNYAVTSVHPDAVAVLGIAGFVFLSFFFLMTTGWYYINKSLRKAVSKWQGPELHYKSDNEQQNYTGVKQ